LTALIGKKLISKEKSIIKLQISKILNIFLKCKIFTFKFYFLHDIHISRWIRLEQDIYSAAYLQNNK